MFRFVALMLLVVGFNAFRVLKKRNASISIVTGQSADDCEWTHQVGLSGAVGDAPSCGGSLIRPDWVLTAAHCLNGDRIYVIAGEWSTVQKSGNEQCRWSSLTLPHEKYNEDYWENHDIALIKLEQPFELKEPFNLNKCIGTVRMPEKPVAPGTLCWITGWGLLEAGGEKPTILQEANVTTISNIDCVKTYDYAIEDISSNMLCAQGKNANGDIIDACQQDSGGPLVCDEGGFWVLHGVTSWGAGCAGPSHPGVWSRVFEQLTWIKTTMATHGSPWSDEDFVR